MATTHACIAHRVTERQGKADEAEAAIRSALEIVGCMDTNDQKEQAAADMETIVHSLNNVLWKVLLSKAEAQVCVRS